MANTFDVKLKIKVEHMLKLNLLRTALSEKMNKEMTLDQLIEHIIADFLESK